MKSEIPTPKLSFTHAGVNRTLAKHPVVQQQLRAGLITAEAALARPWYLRFDTAGKAKSFKLAAIRETEAIREAKDILKTRESRPNDFAAFLQAQAAQRGLTIGRLAEEWYAAGLPFSATRTRTTAAAGQLRGSVDRALDWWWDKVAAGIKPSTHAEYVVWRRQNTRGTHAGSRSADIELAALSCLCQWAVHTERLPQNPFENRERFTDPATINHCHNSMPANDDELHRVLSYFFAPVQSDGSPSPAAEKEWRQRVVVGAWLAFTPLTGLRPGEHSALQRIPESSAFPADLRAAPHGLIYPLPDGTRRMKVLRTKHGQNPAVIIHPTLRDFLDHYLAWLAANIPQPADQLHTQLFPGIEGEGKINAYLRRACVAAGVKAMKPHGFGRAYYVRVRRSQGIDDSSIAAELGQKSDGSLIRSVYGDPMDPVGGNLHDWLPANGLPAWHALKVTNTSNIVALRA